MDSNTQLKWIDQRISDLSPEVYMQTLANPPQYFQLTEIYFVSFIVKN
jgi:hypothetical protein